MALVSENRSAAQSTQDDERPHTARDTGVVRSVILERLRDRLVQRTYAAAKPPNGLRQLPDSRASISFEESRERLAGAGQLVPLSSLGSAQPDAIKHVVEPGNDHNRGLPKRVSPPDLQEACTNGAVASRRGSGRTSRGDLANSAESLHCEGGRRSTPNLFDPPPARVFVRQRGVHSRIASPDLCVASGRRCWGACV